MQVTVYWMEADGLVYPTQGTLADGALLVDGERFTLFHETDGLRAYARPSCEGRLNVKLPPAIARKLYPAPVLWHADSDIEAFWSSKNTRMSKGSLFDIVSADDDVDSVVESDESVSDEEEVCSDAEEEVSEEESEEEPVKA